MDKTILIIDDHPIFRRGLKDLIANFEEFSVKGEAGDGEEAVKKTEELKPDIAIVDITLPDMNGIDLIKQIHEASSLTFVMMMSMHNKPHYVNAAMNNGAVGYITKDSAPEYLQIALKTIVSGETYFEKFKHDKHLKDEFSEVVEEVIDEDIFDRLTNREREILNQLLKGLKTKDISEKFELSVRTVENHKASITEKLEVHSNFELWNLAANRGLINLDNI